VLQYLLPLTGIWLVVRVYRAVALRCGERPSLRAWCFVLGIAGIGIAVALIQWLYKPLEPPWSESPSGIIILLWRFLVICAFALTGLGSLIGAAKPKYPRRAEQ